MHFTAFGVKFSIDMTTKQNFTTWLQLREFLSMMASPNAGMVLISTN
jgi:hypothetical protein